MKTHVGMSYEEWQKASGVKSEVQKESERGAWHRDAHQGMTGYEIERHTPTLDRQTVEYRTKYGIWEPKQ